MVLLISYDLNGRERPSSYTAVRKVIEQRARSSVRPLYSQWLVDTDESAEMWRDRVKAVADADDRILVVVVREWSGYLGRDALDWLDEHI